MEEVIVMKKRTCLVLVVGLMSLILAGGAAAKKKKLFLLDWIIYGKHAPFFAAKNFGFYKKQGLNIFYERGFGSGDTAKRIAAKVAPFGFADTGSVIGARVAGAKVVEVGMIHAKAPYAIYTLKNKQIGIRCFHYYISIFYYVIALRNGTFCNANDVSHCSVTVLKILAMCSL